MYFYRKLRSFSVDISFMKMFYSCFIESILTFSFICWFGSLTLKDRNRLLVLWKCVVRSQASSHPLFPEYRLLPSGRWYMVPRCRTNEGSSLYSGNSGWLGSARMASAFLVALTLYRTESSSKLIPAILPHIFTILFNLFLSFSVRDPNQQEKVKMDSIKQE